MLEKLMKKIKQCFVKPQYDLKEIERKLMGDNVYNETRNKERNSAKLAPLNYKGVYKVTKNGNYLRVENGNRVEVFMTPEKVEHERIS